MTPVAFDDRPNWWTGLLRGFTRRCPHCTKAPAFRGYLKVVDKCSQCSAPLGLTRADDAPPYFTIVVVGHIVIPLMLLAERLYHPADWVHAALWLPLTVVLTLAFLPYVKGGVLGLMWGIGVRGDESGERVP